jgi:polysaccharide pyruvyl transferase WcaK-like protein
MSEDAPKIVLITPYSGGNLGDAAIQEAAIENIRGRTPHADISLVTLDPEVTSRLHGLHSFPISRRLRPAAVYDETATAGVHRPIGRSPREQSGFKRLYTAVVPGTLRRGLRKVRARLIALYFEGRHIVLAFKFLRGRNRLVVSGGGQLDEHWGGAWAHPYALFKWSTLSRLLGVDVTILSVGASRLDSVLTRFFVARTLTAARYRSYRDGLSKEKVAFVEKTKSDPVFPDLVFSYGHQRKERSHRDGRRLVAVSPIAYLTQHRQSARNVSIFQRYVLDLAFFVEDLAEQGYDILVFVSAALDRPLARDIVDRVSVRPAVAGKISACYPTSPKDLLEALQGVDVVVASRLHGILLSHIANLPVLAIPCDVKVTTYMSDMGMTDFMLDLDAVSRDSLARGFEHLVLRSDELRHYLSSKVPELAGRLGMQYDNVFPGPGR